MNFDEQPGLSPCRRRSLPGVKRLLTDNGYAIGAIDGKPARRPAWRSTISANG